MTKFKGAYPWLTRALGYKTKNVQIRLRLTILFFFLQKAYDQVLQIITHFLHLVTCLHSNEDEDDITEIRRRIHTVVRVVDPRTTAGDSLLHLSVMKNNTLKTQHTQNMFEEGKFAFFPSVEVAKLLVECGAKINAYNHNANSPLHTASNTMNYRQEVSNFFSFANTKVGQLLNNM